MHNDLFSIGPLTVHGYGLMIGLGVVAALLLSWRRAEKRNMSQDGVTTLTMVLLISGFLCAKLVFLLTHPDLVRRDLWTALGSEGFVVYGGIMGGLLGAWIFCRRRRESLLRWADLVLPGVAVAQGLGRIGCYLAGCCYGKVTASPLGVVFPAGSLAPAGIPLLPTQLFSAAGDLLLAGALLLLDRKKRPEGALLAWYLLLYGVGRFFVEFLRDDVRGSVGALSVSQFLSLFAVAGAGLTALWLRRRENHAE